MKLEWQPIKFDTSKYELPHKGFTKRPGKKLKTLDQIPLKYEDSTKAQFKNSIRGKK